MYVIDGAPRRLYRAHVYSGRFSRGCEPDSARWYRSFRRQGTLVLAAACLIALAACGKKPLPAPELVGPTDGAVLTNTPRAATLSWNPVAGAATYQVEVECLHCAAAGEWSPLPGTPTSTTATSYTITWPGDNQGRWRITARRSNGAAGTASGWWGFQSRTGPAQLAAPVRVGPANGAVLTNFPRNATLTWKPVEGAAKYRVEVECLHCTKVGRWSPMAGTPTTTTATSYTITWPGDNPGRWRITALRNDGTAGTASGWWGFEYRTPASQLAAPAQVSPANGAVLTNFPRNGTLTWKPVEGAAKYRVELQCLHCMKVGQWSPMAGTPTTTTATSFSFSWPGDNQGRWRVTAIAADGSVGLNGDWSQFEFRTG